MNGHYKFVNTPLPYAFEAMEPYIDKKAMYLHHDKHLQTYIDNLNRTLSNHPELQNWTLEQLIINAPCLPKEIRSDIKNNGGGVFNHQFYFFQSCQSGFSAACRDSGASHGKCIWQLSVVSQSVQRGRIIRVWLRLCMACG